MVKIDIPVYYTRFSGRGIKKKEKTSLISFNWYSSMNSFAQRDFKRKYHDILINLLPSKLEPLKGEYQIEYIYHYKNIKSDLPNVVSLISKILNDLLQEVALVEDDNVKFLKKEIAVVGTQDKEHPRMEVIISDYEE